MGAAAQWSRLWANAPPRASRSGPRGRVFGKLQPSGRRVIITIRSRLSSLPEGTGGCDRLGRSCRIRFFHFTPRGVKRISEPNRETNSETNLLMKQVVAG